MLQKLLFSIVFLFGIQINSFAQDGKLDKGKESLKTSNSSGNNGKTTSKASNNGRNTRNNDLENPFARIIWSIAVYTFYGIVIESPFEKEGKMHDAEIAHYPYELVSQGNFIYTDSTNYNITRVDVLSTFVIENKNLYGNNLDVNFRFLKRFAFGLDYLYLTEKIEDNRDSFALYSALLKYHRIRAQRFDAWFGLGIMHVASTVNKSGFGMGVGAQWFVKKPVSLNFSHKWTNINQQEIHKTKFLLNYHLKNYQISSGYEHFKIGVSKIGAFSLGFGAIF